MNARAFRNEINRIKTNLTDKELFLSEGFKYICNNIIVGVSRAWKQKITVYLDWGKPTGKIAYATGNNVVYLNLNNQYVQNLTRGEKYKIYIGLILHECGHRLFSSFKLLETIRERIEKEGVLSYTNCETTNEYLFSHPKSRKNISKLVHDYLNAVEDGHIEIRLLDKFHGYGKYLQFLREINKSQFSSFEEMKKSLPDESTIFNMVLYYSIYGERLASAELDDPTVKAFEYIVDLIDLAKYELKTETRYQLVLEAFDQLLSYLIHEKEEQQKSDDSSDDDNSNSSDNSSNSDNENSDTENDNSSTNGEDSGSDEESSNSNNEESCNGESYSDDKNSNSEDENQSSDAEATESEEENSESENNGSTSNNDGDSSNEKESTTSNCSNTTNGNSNSSAASNTDFDTEIENMCNGIQNDKEEECHDNSLEALADNEQGQLSNENESTSNDDNSESNNITEDDDISKLEQDVAKNKANEVQEQEITKMMSTLKNGMKFGNFHDNVTGVFTRQDAVETSDFEKLSAEVKVVLRRLISEFKKKIRDMQMGDVESGLYCGQRVYQPYRQDLRRFSKNRAPEDIPDMSFVLLVDESGSMSGQRQYAARKSALLLYYF